VRDRTHGRPTDGEFVEFATVEAGRLRRAAYLMCGDWHMAQDLTQTALARVYVAWPRVRSSASAYAFAQRTLVNAFLAHRRRRSASEIPVSEPVATTAGAAEGVAPELRLVLLAALATLPRRARAVVVLRYWEDLSVEQVAAAVGCSPGTVRSQSARALGKLRHLLGDVESDLVGTP